MTLSPELAALRDEAAAMTCEAWAIRCRWKLSAGIDQAGPCPVCGGTDRFAIHTVKNTFLCRRCEIKGGGVIDLVMQTQHVGFVEACEIITGRTVDAPADERKLAALRAQAEADEKARQAEADRYREAVRHRGYQIWNDEPATCKAPWPLSGGAGGGYVARYLSRRGIDLAFGQHEVVHGSELHLRERAAHAWREEVPDSRPKAWRTVHTGPAMIAAVLLPNGRFGSIHQTWIDLEQPKGKLVLPPDEKGKPRPAKKVLGSKKGGAIRLYAPGQGLRPARRIVMGEGIETTLTALAHAFEPETAYWAGVDLGNMAGRAARDAAGKILHDVPDMDDRECFLPPDWCEELIYLCDSDEPANHTVEKVTRGLRRAGALNPRLTTWLVPPIGDGQDLNDLVRVDG